MSRMPLQSILIPKVTLTTMALANIDYRAYLGEGRHTSCSILQNALQKKENIHYNLPLKSQPHKYTAGILEIQQQLFTFSLECCHTVDSGC